jgi:hypothetical protein
MPVFSVADGDEARALLVMTCPTTADGAFVAPELAQVQNLANLAKFSDRLAASHEQLQRTGHCRCTDPRALQHEGGVVTYGSKTVHYCQAEPPNSLHTHLALCGRGSLAMHLARLDRGNRLCRACVRLQRQREKVED